MCNHSIVHVSWYMYIWIEVNSSVPQRKYTGSTSTPFTTHTYIVHVYTYIHTYIVHVYTYIHTYIHCTYIHCTYIHVHTYMYAHLYTYTMSYWLGSFTSTCRYYINFFADIRNFLNSRKINVCENVRKNYRLWGIYLHVYMCISIMVYMYMSYSVLLWSRHKPNWQRMVLSLHALLQSSLWGERMTQQRSVDIIQSLPPHT